MARKRKIDPELELALIAREADERKVSDSQYAKKIVEYVVFAVIAAAAMRVVYGSFDIFIGQYFRAPVTVQTPVAVPSVVTVPASSNQLSK